MDFFIFPMPNGNMCVRNKSAAISIVDMDGEKHVKSFKNKIKIIPYNYPFIRGLCYFILGGYYFFKGLVESVTMSLSVKKEKSSVVKKAGESLMISPSYIIATVLGLLALFLSSFLLGYIPAKLSFVIMGDYYNMSLRNALIGFIKVIMFLIMLLSLKCIPAMQEFFRFNSASNQAKRSGAKLEVLETKSIHEADGFLNFVIFSFCLSLFMISFIAIGLNFWLNPILNLLVFVLCVSISYEILHAVANAPKFAIRQLAAVTSFFVTAKPTITQEETALSALSEVILLEKQKDRELINSKSEGQIAFSIIYTEVKNKLLKAGINDPSETDWLIATCLDKNRAELKLTPYITTKEYRDILKATLRRAKGEPLSNIFGFVEFYGLRFNVNKQVLTPRPETELLVETAIKEIKKRKKCAVLDLGTGSGAIAIVIKKYTDANVTAVDISKSALETAKENAINNEAKIEFVLSDLFSKLKHKKFDIIISNPPYIKTGDIAKLDEEVKNYDPRLALDGGEDGLSAYRHIIGEAHRHLKKNAAIMFEVGKGQSKQVSALLNSAGYVKIETIKDYSKIDRIVIGFKDGRNVK